MGDKGTNWSMIDRWTKNYSLPPFEMGEITLRDAINWTPGKENLYNKLTQMALKLTLIVQDPPPLYIDIYSKVLCMCEEETAYLFYLIIVRTEGEELSSVI